MNLFDHVTNGDIKRRERRIWILTTEKTTKESKIAQSKLNKLKETLENACNQPILKNKFAIDNKLLNKMTLQLSNGMLILSRVECQIRI